MPNPIDELAAGLDHALARNADPADAAADTVMLAAERVIPDRGERRAFYDRLIDALEGIRDSNWPSEAERYADQIPEGFTADTYAELFE